MFKKIKFVLRTFLSICWLYALLTKPCLELTRLLGEIFRNTHSIEKGLFSEYNIGFTSLKV